MRRQSWFFGILLLASVALVIRFAPIPTVGAQPYYPQFVMGTLPSSGTPLTVSCPNDTSSGTGVNLIVKLSNAGNCLTAQIGDFQVNSTLSTLVGIVVSGAGTSGNASVAVAGVVTCLFDNSVTIADWVSGSAATPGNCSDAGAATSAHSTQGGGILGFAIDGGSAGLHKVFLQQQQGSPGNTLWMNQSRLDASAFAGQFLFRKSAGSAAVGLQIGGSGASNPCLGDSGAILKVQNGGTGTGCTGTAALSTGNLSAVGSLTSSTGPNYTANETGANNALVATLTDVNGVNVPVTDGLCVNIKIAHTLQAGANTLNLNGSGADAIGGHRTGTSIGTGYVANAIIGLCFTSGGSTWLDMSQ